MTGASKVCCGVLPCVAVCCSMLHCVAVCCSALQCVAVNCSVLQGVAVCCSEGVSTHRDTPCNLQQSATPCITLQHLQHAATYCNPLLSQTDPETAIVMGKYGRPKNTLCIVATHCNTLQHPATPFYTTQDPATPCNTLQLPATSCNILQLTATHYSHRQIHKQK